MPEIRIKVSNNLLEELPKKKEEIQEILRLGLKLIKSRRRKAVRSIVEKTSAAISIKDHKLIEDVIDQIKYGE
ncbi:MAG: hypothetical protein HZA12_05795 [Nitrospirae bacterium]|nr:hypothetical protein [Nitrospirota bacterium]